MADTTHEGFKPGNTSGLNRAKLTAPNRALGRPMAAGLGEHKAKLTLNAAVRDWLLPCNAADTDLERSLAGRSTG